MPVSFKIAVAILVMKKKITIIIIIGMTADIISILVKLLGILSY